MKRTAMMAVLCSMAIAPVAQAQIAKRSVVVDQTEAVVTVTKVDREARTVTFRGPKGGVATLQVPREAPNFDQVKPGQQYKMKYVEAAAVEISKGGAPGSTSSEQVTLSPKGAKPGGTLVRTQQVAGVIDAVDHKNRYLAVRGPKGNVLALKAADDVPIDHLNAGDRISVTYTQALAIEMAPQKK